MNKVCIVYTTATGLHKQFEKVYKKNLFGFARMTSISWVIAIRTNNNEFKIEKEEHHIIKPRCMVIPENHIITNDMANIKGTEIEIVLDKFRSDMKDKSIKLIISIDLDFHLRTLQAELIRYNKAMDFNKYLLIDVNDLSKSVFGKISNLNELCLKCLNKNISNEGINICEIFFNLYNSYEKCILET